MFPHVDSRVYKGIKLCVYIINAYALKVKAILSEGMTKNRKRETERVRVNMVKEKKIYKIHHCIQLINVNKVSVL